MPYYLSTEKAVMLLLAVPLICFLLVIAVVLPEMTTNVLLQLACGPFHMSLSDGRSVGAVQKFSHYAYDGCRAIHWLNRTWQPIAAAMPPNADVVVISAPTNGFTPFVRACGGYLAQLHPTSTLRVGIVLGMRHSLSVWDTPGNFLRLAVCMYDPAKSVSRNASSIRQCISHGKKTNVCHNAFQLVMHSLPCDVIVSSWGIKQGALYVTPPVCSSRCPKREWDSRQRWVVLSNHADSWIIHSEFYNTTGRDALVSLVALVALSVTIFLRQVYDICQRCPPSDKG